MKFFRDVGLEKINGWLYFRNVDHIRDFLLYGYVLGVSIISAGEPDFSIVFH